MGRSGLVVVLVALLFGMAIGYVIGSGNEPPVTAPDEEPVPVRPRDRVAEPVPAPSAADYASLKSWIEAIPAPDVSRGNAVISGTVRTKDGRTLAGVLIRAHPVRPGRPSLSVQNDAPPPDEELISIVQRTVTGVRRRIADRREARTGADGTFRFTGLADLPHSVQAWLTDHRIAAPGVNLWRVAPGSTIELVATPILTTRVSVTLPDGSTPESAFLRAKSDDDRDRSDRWRPDDDAIELAPGNWTIFATAGEFQEFRSDGVEIVVTQGELRPVVKLHCRALRCIRGHVIFPEGEERTHCEVAAVRVAPGSVADPKRLIRAEKSESLWPGDKEGYVFRDLSAGTWLVGALLDHRRVVAHGTVELTNGVSVLDLRIPAPKASEYVVVTVLDPDGEPIGDADFDTEYEVENAHSSGGSRVQKLGPGRWRVYHHVKPESYDEGGRHAIGVRTGKYGSKTIWYDRKTTRDLTFRFDAPATLFVTITGYVGSGLEGALSLSLSPLDAEGSRAHVSSGSISAEGVRKFGPAPPGAYELTLSLKRDRHNHVTVEKVRVDLKAGENRHAFLPPKTYDLTVLTEGLPEGARLRLRPKDRSSGWWGTDPVKPENGRVRFDRLPAGDYVVEVDGGMKMMFVSVPGKSVVRFEVSVVNAMAVTISDPEGGFAKAGFRDGDLIVGVDGKEFRDIVQMRGLLMAAFGQESTKLTVIRGGRSVVLEVNFGTLRSSRNQGGNLEPASR